MDSAQRKVQENEEIQIDVGGLEIAFRALYQLPLVINSLIFVVLVCGAVAALFGGLLSGAVPGAQLNGADTQLAVPLSAYTNWVGYWLSVEFWRA